MSKQYKEYLSELCNKAENGNIEASQKLLDEAAYWSAKNKQLIEEMNKNK